MPTVENTGNTSTDVGGVNVYKRRVTGISALGDVTETKDTLGGRYEIAVLYVIYPEGMTTGKVQMIVAPRKDFAGEWDLYGDEAEQVTGAGVDGACRTVQMPAHGVIGLGVRVTEAVVTVPPGGKIEVVVCAR